MNDISIDFSKNIGTIRPLHGVNNGPLTYGFVLNTSQYFKEAGIPYSRLHDTEYPYGSGHFVDVPCIFKDFDRDPADPSSYDFALTDLYIQAICDCGTQVFYRLGVSIEHAPLKRNVYAPKDAQKWARICEGIIRHYNEGWANGFHYNIQYWEIWNEPEGEGTWRKAMWVGSNEEYFNLYATTAKHLKSCFPYIKVGGYASCGFYGAFCQNPTPDQHKFLEFADDFFAYITSPQIQAPLDFFSWHIYSGDLYLYESFARYARGLLQKYHLESAMSILDEWNYSGDNMMYTMATEVGAALASGALCVMQHNEVDLAHYYDAQPAMCYCGIFTHETAQPTKTFYALKAWNALYQLRNEVYSASNCPDVRVCAASDGTSGGILLSSYCAEDPAVRIHVSGLANPHGIQATVYCIDRENTFEIVSAETFHGDAFTIQRKKDRYTTLYIELKQMQN